MRWELDCEYCAGVCDGSNACHCPITSGRVFNSIASGTFVVNSGPCVVTQGGRCAGRPGGYYPDESCSIEVLVGGILGPCPTFDTGGCNDVVTLPGHPASCSSNACACNDQSHMFDNGECPVGEILVTGDIVNWQSDGSSQGGSASGCMAGRGGRPRSYPGTGLQSVLGGGWELCFA
jgi:hypothetical protein